MTRYTNRSMIAGLAGLASVTALAVAAAPSGATLVCPPGVPKLPRYCMNVPPIATTGTASHVGPQKATLNGTSGPNVAGGDITTYFFKYGKSSHYARKTPSGTVGSCPPGDTGCRSVPATKNVSARISGLLPCTAYHFQIVSKNPDGTTQGSDSSFTTAFENPVSSVQVSPQQVRHGRLITVQYTLKFTADVTIELRRSNQVVKTVHPGVHKAGTYAKTIKTPAQTGTYTVRILASSNCGTQKKDKGITVT